MLRKLRKASRILLTGDALWRRALRHGVAAAVEHVASLRLMGEMATVVDIGANRGQFALAARHVWPEARIWAFEPIPWAAATARRLFAGDEKVTVIEAAVAPTAGPMPLHLSRRDDSSSLLPIGRLQREIFPGTEEAGTLEVTAGPLSQHLDPEAIAPPALLKLDVQGYELACLQACEPLLDRFAAIYLECSFLPLYDGQALADEVIAWARARGFRLAGFANPSWDATGRLVQADVTFFRAPAAPPPAYAFSGCRA